MYEFSKPRFVINRNFPLWGSFQKTNSTFIPLESEASRRKITKSDAEDILLTESLIKFPLGVKIVLRTNLLSSGI